MIQTGEKIHVGEDEKAKEEVEGGSGGKAKAGPPLRPLSQPALSPKLWSLLGEDRKETETVPCPAAPENTQRLVGKSYCCYAAL